MELNKSQIIYIPMLMLMLHQELHQLPYQAVVALTMIRARAEMMTTARRTLLALQEEPNVQKPSVLVIIGAFSIFLDRVILWRRNKIQK